VSFIGSYLPFAKTKAEREQAGDPRLSIPERYAGREQYLGLFAEAAMQAVPRPLLGSGGSRLGDGTRRPGVGAGDEVINAESFQ